MASNDSLLGMNEMGDLKRRLLFLLGALSRFTIFALGILPYIAASIIMQLITVVSPTLEALKKANFKGGVFPTR